MKRKNFILASVIILLIAIPISLISCGGSGGGSQNSLISPSPTNSTSPLPTNSITPTPSNTPQYVVIQKTTTGESNGTYRSVGLGVTGTAMSTNNKAAQQELWEGSSVSAVNTSWNSNYSVIFNWDSNYTAGTGAGQIKCADGHPFTGDVNINANGNTVVWGMIYSDGSGNVSYNGTMSVDRTSVSGTYSVVNNSGQETDHGTFSGLIKSPDKTCTIPGGKTYSFMNNNNPGSYVNHYYYGNPPVNVGNTTLHLGGSPSSSEIPYSTLDLPISSGQEAGLYSIYIDGSNVQINDNSTYLAVPTITSPSDNSDFNIANPITVTWNSLGTDYVYFVMAMVNSSSYNTSDIFWSQYDLRTLSFHNPASLQEFINNCQTDTTAVIPANLFVAGKQTMVHVIAFNKNISLYSNNTPYGNIILNQSSYQIYLNGK
jgi:hypothetical protein